MTTGFSNYVSPLLDAVRSVIKLGSTCGISHASPESKSAHTIIFTVQLSECATEHSVLNLMYNNLQERKQLGLLYNTKFKLESQPGSDQILLHCTSESTTIEHLTVWTTGRSAGNTVQLVYSSSRIIP